MRAQTCPASFSALNVCSVYSRVSTALSPATTWKHSGWNSTPLYSKRIGSSLPWRRPRMRNSSAALLTMGEAAIPHRLGERFQERRRVVPGEARIGDRDAVLQRLARHQVLATGVEVALHHHAHDAFLARGELHGDVGADVHLLAVLLRRIRVREVDHEVRREARGGELAGGRFHARRVVVGLLAAAQDHVAVVVADGLEDRGLARLRHAHERVRSGGAAHRAYPHPNPAARPPLSATRPPPPRSHPPP